MKFVPLVRKMPAYTIDFQPVGRRGQCRRDQSLLDCAHKLGVGISTVCGGEGTCGTCRVQLLSGTLSKPTSREMETFSTAELEAGWRLACQAYPRSHSKLNIPPESMTTPQRTQLEGLEIPVTLEPPVKSYYVKLPAPSLADQQGDGDRLLRALNRQHHIRANKIDIDVLRVLSPKLRDWDWQCRAVVRGDEVIAVNPLSSRQLGLAVDLGTTKIAGYLVDLADGCTIATRGMMNPQIQYGEDVISRINTIIQSPDSATQLQKLAVDAISELATSLCTEASVSLDEITEAVVVGNTAMHHLFLCLPVKQLALIPFVPAVSQALDIKTRNLGLHFAPGAYVHSLPNIAGFVGADHVAMLLATEVKKAEGLTIALDIGTNTEVSLVKRGRITSVSCASGPAFEGGHIKDGMRAAAGAIERLRISKDSVQYQTIDDAPPTGICGSGIIDALAQLYLAGVVDKTGRMNDGHPRVQTSGKQREFVLVSPAERRERPAIVFTQHDVRELQLGKAAIRTGIQVLLDTNKCSETEITQVIIAGAFGSYLDVSSAVAIGMLPPLPLDIFRQVGNAAGMGAKRALISLRQRRQAQALASKIRYIELGSTPDFNHIFLQAMNIGHFRIEQGKRKEID